MSVPGSDLLGRLSPDRAIPTDVVAVLLLVALADVVVLAPGVPTPVRALFGAVLLFFLPGYGVVTALYPARSDGRPAARGWHGRTGAGSPEAAEDEVHTSTDGGDTVPRPPGGNSVLGPPGGNTVSGGERVALAVGASLAVLPLVGLGLSVSGLGFALQTEVGAITAVAGGGVLVGWARRSSLPAHRRFGVDPRERLASVREAVRGKSGAGTAAWVLLVVAALFATATLSYALLAPPGGTGYTDLSLLTRADDGDLVASGYPSELETGETREVVTAVENREGRTVTYTLVVELQRVRTEGGELQVVESRRVDRREVTVQSGDRATETVAIAPEMEGEDLRVAVMLYEGSPAESRDLEDAYRYTYLWVDVGSGPDDGAGVEDGDEVPVVAGPAATPSLGGAVGATAGP